MKQWIERITSWVVRMAETKYGGLILFLAAFSEAILTILPFTILFMLLAVASPKKAFRYALLCVIGATLGAILAYGIGYYIWIKPDGGFTSFVHFFFNYIPGFTEVKYFQIQAWVGKWGVLALVIVGFTPMPFELVTISSGVFQMSFPLYILATLAGRFLRYFLMAFLFWKFGATIKQNFERNLRIFALGFTVIFVVILLFLKGGLGT